MHCRGRCIFRVLLGGRETNTCDVARTPTGVAGATGTGMPQTPFRETIFPPSGILPGGETCYPYKRPDATPPPTFLPRRVSTHPEPVSP